MISAGILGVIGWLLLFFLGYLLSGGRTDGVNEMAVEFVIPIVTGVIGAVFSLITGVMIVAKRTLPGKVRISFAVLTALLYLPAIVLLSSLWWFFAAVPVFLFGVAPPVIYLVRSAMLRR
jgi:hypothetical protein